MMNRVQSLFPWVCSIALLATIGCAEETGADDGSAAPDEEGTVAEAKEALSNWGPMRGTGGSWLEGPTSGNYFAMSVNAGGIIDGVQFYLANYHNDNDGWGWHWGTHWMGRYGGNGGATKPDMICPSNYPYIVGVHGQAGDNIGSLGIVCGSTVSSGRVFMSAYGTNAWGPYSAFQDICDYPLIVTDIDLRTSYYVNGIQIKCSAPIPVR